MDKFTDLTGMKFGKLTVIKFLERRKTASVMLPYWECKCDCGNIVARHSTRLKEGNKTVPLNCGCSNWKCNGKSNSKLYPVWRAMKERCNNPKNKDYKYYGERGISYTKEWEDFLSFYDWALNNGYEEKLELERIDNDKNYSPDNCKWVTRQEQANNTRRNNLYTAFGEVGTARYFCDKYNIPYSAFKNRIYTGMEVEKILTTPVKKIIRNERNCFEYNGIKGGLEYICKTVNVNFYTIKKYIYILNLSLDEAIEKYNKLKEV